LAPVLSPSDAPAPGLSSLSPSISPSGTDDVSSLLSFSLLDASLYKGLGIFNTNKVDPHIKALFGDQIFRFLNVYIAFPN